MAPFIAVFLVSVLWFGTEIVLATPRLRSAITQTHWAVKAFLWVLSIGGTLATISLAGIGEYKAVLAVAAITLLAVRVSFSFSSAPAQAAIDAPATDDHHDRTRGHFWRDNEQHLEGTPEERIDRATAGILSEEIRRANEPG